MTVLKELIPESMIRISTKEALKYGATNLAQAFPDYDAREEVKNLAIEAIKAGHNQYSDTWGTPVLREAIAQKYQKKYGVQIDPNKNVLVCCGCMEGLRLILKAIIWNGGPDTEIIIIEPFYESFVPQTILEGGKPVFVNLKEKNYDFDIARLEEKINKNTKVVMINSPNNPCGKMFSENELKQIYDLCTDRNIYIVSDETYEHIYYKNYKHISILTFENRKGNLIFVTGIGKTYSVTGWRVGFVIADENVIKAIRASHDYFSVCAPTPFQYAAADLLKFPESYYEEIRKSYDQRKIFLLDGLRNVGFNYFEPQGAYYVLVDFSEIGNRLQIYNDIDFTHYLIKEIKVAAVPGSAFYGNKELGKSNIRFTFCKKMETLVEAKERLQKLVNL